MRPLLCCLALVLLPQCGGAATSEGAKSAPDDAGSAAPSDHARPERAKPDGDEDEAPSGSGATTSEKSKGPTCDDGTCSRCGNGICPTGWYCDERATGGSACSWLAECAEKPSCGCVTRVLGSSCKCREENGGLTVACD